MRALRWSTTMLLALAAGAGAAQSTDQGALLDKVSDYVAAYERTFVGVVAEETCRREVKPARAGTDARGFPIGRRNAGAGGQAMIAAALVLAPQAAPPPPSLALVLQRAADYVTTFHARLSRIVAEERYTQKSETIWSGKRKGTTTWAERTLRSDLMLVKPAGADDWLQYRDVFEVDGERVRERGERLPALLADRSLSAAAQVERIRRESARYNIGSIERDVNVPVLAMRFLSPANQPRFTFRRAADRSTATASIAPDTAGAFHVTAEVWAIDYEEVRKPTLIHTLRNKDLPSRGRFWIEPDTGRVLMTELRAGDKNVRGTIDVSYQSEPLMGLLVPIEMREEYVDRSGAHITGVATYGRFRVLKE
jgi:hypothetical protein